MAQTGSGPVNVGASHYNSPWVVLFLHPSRQRTQLIAGPTGWDCLQAAAIFARTFQHDLKLAGGRIPAQPSSHSCRMARLPGARARLERRWAAAVARWVDGCGLLILGSSYLHHLRLSDTLSFDPQRAQDDMHAVGLIEADLAGQLGPWAR